MEALVDVEVVLHLGTVVASLGVRAVVVSDGRKDRHSRDGETVGLEEAGVPIVVLSPALLVHASLLTLIDVVAERQDEADVVVSNEPFQHVGDAPLAAAGLPRRPASRLRSRPWPRSGPAAWGYRGGARYGTAGRSAARQGRGHSRHAH